MKGLVFTVALCYAPTAKASAWKRPSDEEVRRIVSENLAGFPPVRRASSRRNGFDSPSVSTV